MATKTSKRPATKVATLAPATFPDEGRAAIEKFAPDPNNVRPVTPASVESLAASIRDVGLLNPLLVRPGEGGKFHVVAGHRRLAAAKAAGLKLLPYRMVPKDNAATAAAAENLERAELTPLQEAAAVGRMVEAGRPHKAIADAFGRPLAWVARRAQLGQLSAEWRKRASDPKRPESRWTVDTLVKIARLPAAAQDRLVKAIPSWMLEQERRVAEQAGEETRELAEAPFPIADVAIAAACKALVCAKCPKRSDAQPGLFDPGEVKEGARCLDAACFEAKRLAHVTALAAKLPKDGLVVGDAEDVKGAKLPPGVRVVAHYSFPGHAKPIADPVKVPAGYVAAVDADAGRYVAVPSSAKGEGKGATGGTREAGKALTLKEKQEGLRLKRLRAVGNAIADALGKAKTLPKTCSLEALVGLVLRFSTRTSGDSGAPLPGMKKYDAAANANEVWQLVAAEIARQWKYTREHEVDELAAVASIMGLDYRKLEADAEIKCPVPRAWAADMKPAKGKGK